MECGKCGKNIVNDNRKYKLCLDCLVGMLIAGGTIDVPEEWVRGDASGTPQN